jgi:hypothetical protein
LKRKTELAVEMSIHPWNLMDVRGRVGGVERGWVGAGDEYGIMWVFRDLGEQREDFLVTWACRREEAYVGQVEVDVGHGVVA